MQVTHQDTLAEPARLVRGVATLPSIVVSKNQLPRGKGETVLVVPGFWTGDGSTLFLRLFLQRLGYQAKGWGLGRNQGQVNQLVPRVGERIQALAHAARAPIKLIGWSLGGVLAREAARRHPTCVNQIVTMGTPVVGGPKYTTVADHYRRRGIDLDAVERSVAEVNRTPLPVPITAIYSKKDGVVAWQACIDPNPQNDVTHIEVRTGHAELGFSSAVYRVVARALNSPSA